MASTINYNNLVSNMSGVTFVIAFSGQIINYFGFLSILLELDLSVSLLVLFIVTLLKDIKESFQAFIDVLFEPVHVESRTGVCDINHSFIK